MKISILSTLSFLSLLSFASGKILFKETFDDTWQSRWVQSDWKKSEGTAGDWKLTAGDWYGDAEADKGIQTSQDARFYAISTKFDKPISNKDSELVVQFQVKFPQRIDCGGGYIKLIPSSVDQKNFGGDSPYEIMFGPDVCGTATKRVHAILTKKGTNYLTKKSIPCETDQLSHVYTLIIRRDNTYEVRVDGSKKESGNLADDWDVLPSKTIKDPSVSKPSDWIDDPMMDDPNDKKPEGYDDIPKTIPDPDAQKPEDWSDEDDGEWEAPQIDNPEYKGPWTPKRIVNPDYKGEWKHPEIPNPEYKLEDEKELHHFSDIGGIGIELWQVKAGTMFDNIIIADDVADADQFLNETWKKNKDSEKQMFEKKEQEKREKEEEERKKAEEERKAREAAEKADEDDDEDEDEDEDEEESDSTAKKHDEL